MKKHLILLLLAASPLVAFADDTQIKSGSQAQEWNTYDNGGKTIVYDIYSEYGAQLDVGRPDFEYLPGKAHLKDVAVFCE